MMAPNGFKKILHAKWSNFDDTQKNPPNFQRCWGKMRKISVKNFGKKIKPAIKQIRKRLLPGSGGTDCIQGLLNLCSAERWGRLGLRPSLAPAVADTE